MKKIIYLLLICLVSSLSISVRAESRGAKINLTSDGKGIDLYALNSTRKIIGSAVAEGILDSFTISSLRADGATIKSNGYSICIEAGVGSTIQNFEALIKRLKFVHPKRGTTIAVEASASCQKAPEAQPVALTSCGGLTGKICAAQQICVDDPSDACDPLLGGLDCVGICKNK